MLSLEGDGAQVVSQILKSSQFLAAKTLHAGKKHLSMHTSLIDAFIVCRFVPMLRYPVIGHH